MKPSALQSFTKYPLFTSILNLLWASKTLAFPTSTTLIAEESSKPRLRKRDVIASGISMEQGLHQAAALGAMTILLTAHRAVMNSGFFLSRKAIPTDATIVAVIGFITSAWTSLVMLSGFIFGEKPCRVGVELCLARAAYAPWMLQILFLFWAVGLWDAKYYQERRKMSDERVGLWKLHCFRGPFDWDECVRPAYLYTIYGIMIVAVIATSYGAIKQELFTVGILNIVGVVLFYVGAGGSNKYIQAPHKYRGDMLRIILPTSHSEGSVYILPSKGYGFDAVWSPKILYEHKMADELVMELYSTLRTDEWSLNLPLKTLRNTMVPFLRDTQITDEQLQHLAEWLYLEGKDTHQMRVIRCVRANGVHLIGRDLMYALCHAEYLVFMGKDRLPPHLRAKISLLRSEKRSGGSAMGAQQTIGFQGGIDGYRAAVRWVYDVFNETVDDSALNPTAPVPHSSSALKEVPKTIESYVEQLWEICVQHSEGTVSALYIFTTIWFIEIGNVGGSHIFPLRARSRQGDLVAWCLVWRQAWYGCIIAQLVTMSPIILSAFLAGVLN